MEDPHLIDSGLSNYWGYNTIGFFAPDTPTRVRQPRAAVPEFKAMVKALHAAGIEVILDVVYNHTAEGNELGPTLSFKGIDNPSYYRLVDDNPALYFDSTGTGNGLKMRHPHALQLIMDSLRYWVADITSTDSASTSRPRSPASSTKSTSFRGSSPGPAGPGDQPGEAHRGAMGHRRGRVPGRELPAAVGRMERKVPRHHPRLLARHRCNPAEFAFRLSRVRRPLRERPSPPARSVNFVTAHDGFTLRNLVSYNDKHNDANGEDGRDGSDDNQSWNCGAEGETDDPQISRSAPASNATC